MLKPGVTYSWEQLAAEFDFDAAYISVAGGMISRPQQDALLLITHAGDARRNIYGDYWDDDDLIYTGRGKHGDQKRNGQNRDLGENRRDTYVFEPAGPRQLHFFGPASCVEEWTARALDVDGEDRSVLQFRLRFEAGLKNTSAPAGSTSKGGSEVGRKPRPFDPEQIPAEPAPATKTSNPEETQALREKAVRGHHELLVALAEWLTAQGWSTIEEIPLAVDLWAQMPAPDARVLFEAKTVRAGSEGPRVRSAISQLLEYRFFYGRPDDRLCLVCDRPLSERRVRLLDGLEIAVLWRDGESFQAGSSHAHSILATS